ncbi:MAG: alpha/beta hydrolase [Polyangiaceae bacterium]
MANFVLVHGAWHGGWCYRETARILRARGHEVFTPTLTGLGEKAHLAHYGITLETHVRDVLGTIEAEELSDVILVGHSYGGMLITGVADRIPEKIKSLVYLDAFVPENTQTLNDIIRATLPPEIAALFINGFHDAARTNASGMMNPVPAELFNIAEKNRAWVDRRCVPQALATFEVPMLLSGGGDKVAKRTYVLADGWDPSPYRWFAARYEKDPRWSVQKLPCSHDIMVDMPAELADLLAKEA